ncbi:MAG: hypothetical protein ACYTJ0_02610 [Planctomycetota bacterium]|jgi:hypothetical protein
MAEAARVTSLEALRRFRASFAAFGDEARLALGNAESDVQRAMAWVQERSVHWQHEIRRRERKLAEAKSELYRAETGSRDERPSCVLERRAVARATQLVEEARTKLERCRSWLRSFDRDYMLFKGQLQPLATHVERDVPKGVARLGVMIEKLEAYVRLAPPTSGAGPAGGPSDPEPEPDDGTPDEAGWGST